MDKIGITQELAKARVSKLTLICTSGGIAISVLATFSLWAGNATSGIYSYPAVLVASAFSGALVWPIIAAVIASRLADIEFTNRGWLLMVTSGSTVRKLLSNKAIVGMRSLAIGVLTQSLLTALICTIAHVQDPVLGQWALYFCCMWLTTVVLFLASLLLACAAESQIVTLIFGIASAFISTFAFLLPSRFFEFTPWGYYALTLPFAQNGRTIEASSVNYLPLLALLIVTVIVWQVGSRQLKIWR